MALLNPTLDYAKKQEAGAVTLAGATVFNHRLARDTKAGLVSVVTNLPVGLVLSSYAEKTDSFKVGDIVGLLSHGHALAIAGAQCTIGKQVYVTVATGKVTASASTGNVELIGAMFVGEASSDGDLVEIKV